ncbi:MAG: TIGR03618 family F420-dependent PPOX class oxidoreductase [Acidimicrobiales bacterium]
MAELPASAQALLGTDAVAHVWTNNGDGTPQISVVWVLVQGDEILFGSDGASRKVRNLARDPSIILSIEDTERNERGFQRHLVIRGTARLDPKMPTTLVDQLCRKYTGLANHPLSLRDSPTAVTVRVSVDRISGVGPWVQQPVGVA